jgi:hypothetical protein
MREMRNAYKIFGKSEGKKLFGKPSWRWKGNIEILFKDIDLIRLVAGSCDSVNEY